MSRHLGDFDASTVVYGKFTTYKPSTGAPFTLAGTPALSVYKDNSVTQSTTGVTLTADFDSVTGLNHFAIDTSADGAFYAAGSFFDIVITTGTVDSVSAVGTVVGSFTLRKNSALKPTTAGRTLDVDANGGAEVGSFQAGAITAAAIATDAIDNDAIAADVTAVIADAVWNAATASYGSAGTYGALVETNLDVASSTLATQTSVNTIDDFLDTEIAAIKAKTDSLTFTVAGQVDANIQYVNDTAIQGTGTVGTDEWRKV